MVQWPGARILRRQELDAFLAQALSPKLYEPDQLQELKVTDGLVSLEGGHLALSSTSPLTLSTANSADLEHYRGNLESLQG